MLQNRRGTVSRRSRPNETGKIQLVINTPRSTGGAVLDGNMMRRLAVELNIPFVTTMAGARMEVEAIKEAMDGIPEPRLLEIKSLN